MARLYAAIMALVSLNVVLLRALKNHAGVEGTIAQALAWMGLLGAVGYLVGTIAQSTVDNSVLKVVEDELSLLVAKDTTDAAAANTQPPA